MKRFIYTFLGAVGVSLATAHFTVLVPPAGAESANWATVVIALFFAVFFFFASHSDD